MTRFKLLSISLLGLALTMVGIMSVSLDTKTSDEKEKLKSNEITTSEYSKNHA